MKFRKIRKYIKEKIRFILRSIFITVVVTIVVLAFAVPILILPYVKTKMVESIQANFDEVSVRGLELITSPHLGVRLHGALIRDFQKGIRIDLDHMDIYLLTRFFSLFDFRSPLVLSAEASGLRIEPTTVRVPPKDAAQAQSPTALPAKEFALSAAIGSHIRPVAVELKVIDATWKWAQDRAPLRINLDSRIDIGAILVFAKNTQVALQIRNLSVGPISLSGRADARVRSDRALLNDPLDLIETLKSQFEMRIEDFRRLPWKSGDLESLFLRDQPRGGMSAKLILSRESVSQPASLALSILAPGIMFPISYQSKTENFEGPLNVKLHFDGRVSSSKLLKKSDFNWSVETLVAKVVGTDLDLSVHEFFHKKPEVELEIWADGRSTNEENVRSLRINDAGFQLGGTRVATHANAMFPEFSSGATSRLKVDIPAFSVDRLINDLGLHVPIKVAGTFRAEILGKDVFGRNPSTSVNGDLRLTKLEILPFSGAYAKASKATIEPEKSPEPTIQGRIAATVAMTAPTEAPSPAHSLFPDIAVLRSLDWTQPIRIDALKVGDATIEGIDGTLSLAKEKLVFSGKNSGAEVKRIFGGNISNLEIQVPAFEISPVMRFQCKMNLIDVGALADWIHPREPQDPLLAAGLMDGRLEGQLVLFPAPHVGSASVTGSTFDRVDGKANLRILRGVFGAGRLDRLVTQELLRTPLATRPLEIQTEGLRGDLALDVAKKETTYTIQQARLTTRENNEVVVKGMVTSQFDADLDGEAFLADAPVGGSLRLANSDDKGRLRIPFKMRGPLAKPGIEIGIATVREMLLRAAHKEGKGLVQQARREIGNAKKLLGKDAPKQLDKVIEKGLNELDKELKKRGLSQ